MGGILLSNGEPTVDLGTAKAHGGATKLKYNQSSTRFSPPFSPSFSFTRSSKFTFGSHAKSLNVIAEVVFQGLFCCQPGITGAQQLRFDEFFRQASTRLVVGQDTI